MYLNPQKYMCVYVPRETHSDHIRIIKVWLWHCDSRDPLSHKNKKFEKFHNNNRCHHSIKKKLLKSSLCFFKDFWIALIQFRIYI